MGFFLGVIGLILVVKGVFAIMSPKKLTNFFLRLLDKKDPKRLGFVPLVIGILLVLSSSSTSMRWLVVLLGCGEMAKAVYLFVTPPEKIRAGWWFKASDNARRAIGIFLLVLGILVFVSRV